MAFFALVGICGIGHELGHCVGLSLVCGRWGHIDFEFPYAADGCPDTRWQLIGTGTGPLFSYLMMWLGAALCRRGRDVGVALVFAQFLFARWLQTPLSGDEHLLAVSLVRPRWMAPFVAFAVASLFVLPPVLVAIRRLRAVRLTWLLAPLLIAPIVLDFVERTFGNGLVARLPANVVGVPVVVIGYVVMLALFARRLAPSHWCLPNPVGERA